MNPKTDNLISAKYIFSQEELRSIISTDKLYKQTMKEAFCWRK